ELTQLEDVKNLYVYSSQSTQHVPLGSISSLDHGMKTEKLLRRGQFRTVSVLCFSRAGVLPSEVLTAAFPAIRAFQKTLPPGYKLEVAGEFKEQNKGFKNLVTVLLISISMIYLALLFQFRSGVKPLIVFAAIPYGMVGAAAALYVLGAHFGFMAFLGMVS